MNKIITMTTKGTFTMPAAIRKKLGVNAKGERLAIYFNEATRQVVISKPENLDATHKKLAAYVNKVAPLTEVTGFYHTRKPRV